MEVLHDNEFNNRPIRSRNTGWNRCFCRHPRTGGNFNRLLGSRRLAQRVFGGFPYRNSRTSNGSIASRQGDVGGSCEYYLMSAYREDCEGSFLVTMSALSPRWVGQAKRTANYFN